jgi:translocation and assembly module TamB
LKRWLKRVALGLLTLLGLLVLALAVVWFYVTSDAGADRVRREVLSVLGRTLKGRFEAKRLTLSGGLIVIDDLKLFTPEDELVGEIHRAELDVALAPLLDKNVVIRDAKLTGVRLGLEYDERGLNLVRAVALQHPSPRTPGPGPRFRVDVRKLDLADSFFSYPPYATLGGIGLKGGAVVSGPDLKLDGELKGAATLDGETPLPLSLEVASTSEGTWGFKLDANVALADAKVAGAFHVPSVAAEIRQLVLPPDVARRFLPGSPVQVPLLGHGTIDLKAADLALEAGRARATVAARYHGHTVEALEVEAHEVDLSELFGKGRPSRIDVSAKGQLEDARPSALRGGLEAAATWRTPDGRTLADLSVDAAAAQGRVDLKRAELKTPGAALHARGNGSWESVQLEGELEARDLSELSHAIADFAGVTPPPLGGHGSLAVAVNGPPRHPSVTAHGHFDAVRAASVRAQGVQADVDLPDVARPFEAQVELDASKLVVAERELEDVHARLGTRGRLLDVELSTKGLADLSLEAQGKVDEDARGIALAQLQLRYPEEEWSLENPTHLALGEGFVLDVTRLASADQRIELRATQKAGHVDAGLDAQRVDLAKLPHVLVPESLNLGGLASLHVTAVGSSASPQLDGQVSVRDGTVRNLSKVSVDVNASYGKQRLEARATGITSMGGLDADVDVPLKGDGPLKAHVKLSDVLLEQLGPLLEKDLPLSGQLAAVLDASGTAKKPRATLHVEVSEGVWQLDGKKGPKPAVADEGNVVGTADAHRELRVERLTADLQPDDEGRLKAAVEAHAFGAEAQVKLSSELTLEKLRSKPLDVETFKALLSLPIEAQADVKDLHLRKLVEAQLLKLDVGGRVSLTAHGKGTLQHPDLDGTVSFEHLRSGRLKPQDGHLSLAATRSETRAHLELGQTVLRLDADAKLPLEQLTAVDTLTRAVFNAEGTAGPVALADVLEATPDQPRPQGTVRATLTASGTPAGPKVQVLGTMDHVALGKAPLGHADLALDYENAVTTLAAALVNEAAGRMDAKGRLALDLSQPAVLKGVDFKSAPLTLEVESKGLELKWLSGVSDRVPRVGGRLDASARVSGPLGDPAFTGRAEWKEGSLALLGYGEYRDIEVELDGSDEAVTLKQLYAKSSGGFVKLEGAALKREKGWQLRANGETKGLPIIVDDQLKATATLELHAVGVATPTLIDFTRINVPRATIELPEVRSKDLQDLERPASIVLVRNGVPLSRAQQRKMHFGKAANAAPPAPAKTAVRFTLQAPRNIWVKSSDLQVELGLSDGFEVSLDGTATLSGDLSVKRGRIDVIGRKFDVDSSSTVRLAGPANRANVNVTATHRNDREGVTVTARVTGQLPQFAIHLTSNPPMAESDIFTLLATGRRQLKAGTSQSITNEQAASVVGALAASQIKGVLSKTLPIDVLSVEAGSDGLRGTRVEAGKYVTDQIYVGAEVRYGADPRKGENNAAARLEYQFTPHWSLDVYGGDAGAFGADIVWSRDY